MWKLCNIQEYGRRNFLIMTPGRYILIISMRPNEFTFYDFSSQSVKICVVVFFLRKRIAKNVNVHIQVAILRS